MMAETQAADMSWREQSGDRGKIASSEVLSPGASVRLLLAAAATLAAGGELLRGAKLAPVLFGTLLFYMAVSLFLYRTHLPPANSLRPLLRYAYWLDLACYGLLVIMGGELAPAFVFCFFLPIVVASFTDGFTAGAQVTTAGVGLYVLSAVMSPGDHTVVVLLFRTVLLAGLGYLVARRGEEELALKRRLALLNNVSRISNPRFGVEQTLRSILNQIREYYDADSCLLLTTAQSAGQNLLHRSTRANPAGELAEFIPAEIAAPLLSLPAQLAGYYTFRNARWQRRAGRLCLYDVSKREWLADAADAERHIPADLESAPFITVPATLNHKLSRRLYLVNPRARVRPADVKFLLQVVQHVMPIIENIGLVDRLATDAAEQERHKLARDLHDSVIQPYIGLQMGLKALHLQSVSGHANVESGLERLIKYADKEVADLRRFYGDLQRGGARGDQLLTAARRFAQKFSDATGIAVIVKADMLGSINDRLAAELFQMISEGLSNIRRHTTASQAVVKLTRDERQVELCIEDQGGGTGMGEFTPRSITERAAAVGGCARVEQTGTGHTVIINIPL
jgi:signal transduction histidine kinase